MNYWVLGIGVSFIGYWVLGIGVFIIGTTLVLGIGYPIYWVFSILGIGYWVLGFRPPIPNIFIHVGFLEFLKKHVSNPPFSGQFYVFSRVIFGFLGALLTVIWLLF